MKSLAVMKLGGSALDNLGPMLKFVEFTLAKQPVVVVHGGGPQITKTLQKLGHNPAFVNGLRVTDATTLEVATQVLSGSLNKQLVAALQGLGHKATGLCGVDGQTVKARLKADGELGYVGADLSVQTELLNCLLSASFTPVVAPLGVSEEGQILNINADTTAAAIAVALRATNLIFLTDVDGVLDSAGQVIPSLDSRELSELQSKGVVSQGMLPKLEAALSAAEGGVPGVFITSTSSVHGTHIKKEKLVA